MFITLNSMHIARERNKLTTHFKKMGKVGSCLEHLVENNLVIFS